MDYQEYREIRNKAWLIAFTLEAEAVSKTNQTSAKTPRKAITELIHWTLDTMQSNPSVQEVKEALGNSNDRTTLACKPGLKFGWCPYDDDGVWIKHDGEVKLFEDRSIYLTIRRHFKKK